MSAKRAEVSTGRANLREADQRKSRCGARKRANACTGGRGSWLDDLRRELAAREAGSQAPDLLEVVVAERRGSAQPNRGSLSDACADGR
jgi:hypothetical protein